MAARPRIVGMTVIAAASVLAAAIMVPTSAGPRPQGQTGRSARLGVSPDEVEQCLEVAREVDPELATRLEEARREQAPEAFARALRDAPHLRALADVRREDRQLYDVKVKELRLDAQADRLLKELAMVRGTGSPAAGELEGQLHGLVQQQVAVSLVARGMYLRRLNDHVKALRDQLDHDLGHFPEAVERRMKRMLERLDEAGASDAP
jgi:DNA-binding transcriptional regulator YdaS (Cro superfamily)